METVYDFTLPKGYMDGAGQIHRKGRMRLATAADEISATRDPRVLSNPSYLTIVAGKGGDGAGGGSHGNRQRDREAVYR